MEVDEVRPEGKVGTRNDLAQEEGSRARGAVAVEAVQVVARVVGHDDDERVDVGEHLGEDHRNEAVEIRPTAKGQPEEQWQQHELTYEVRAEHSAEDLGLREVDVAAIVARVQ